MGWVLYNILFSVGYLLMLPHFLMRMRRRGGYSKDFMHRLGCYSDELRAKLTSGDWIWIQAVSVGEVYVALALIDEMRAKGVKQSFVLSTTTSTGYGIIKKKLAPQDQAIYFPSDFPAVMRKVLGIIKPRMLIFVESEIWPNLIRYTKKAGIPIVLVNGRISERSAKGYKKIKHFFSLVINMFDLLLVQSDGDKQRLVNLGAKPDLPEVCGSLKYDVAKCDTAGEKVARSILKRCGVKKSTRVIVGGSTWAGEEEILVEVYEEIVEKNPDTFLILVPRHAERRAEVETVLKNHSVSYVKRSDLNTDGDEKIFENTSVLMVDTTGELVSFYACADVIFVGKSLSVHGGQNFIEPAMCGKPVVVGPNLENFPVVVEDFKKANAFIQVADGKELSLEIQKLLNDDDLRNDLANRGRDLVHEKQGLMGRIAERINSMLVS